MLKPSRKQKSTDQHAASWRALLRSEDVEALIAQAHRDASHFRRKKVFPKQESPK